MQVLAISVQLEHHPRSCTLAHLATEGRNQRLNVGKNNTAARRNGKNSLKRSTVFRFHVMLR